MTLTGSPYLTTSRDVTGEMVAQYRKQGFIKLPGVITKAEAAHYYEAALNVSKTMEALNKGEKVFTQLVNVWREDPTMKELTLHPNLAGLAERLAGVALRLWHDHILIKQPHNEKATEFHQDQPYWPHNDAEGRHCLSVWVALCDVPVEKGCMTFIEGSHRYAGLRPQDLLNPKDLLTLCPDLNYYPRVTLPLQAGDCTFHNSWTAHMATPNFTDDPRVAHIIIYMDADTTFSGKPHPVTDPLKLETGALLEGEFFPKVN